MTNERGQNASGKQQLKEARSRIETLMGKVSDLEGANLALNQKIADMGQDVDDLKSTHRAQMAAKDDEIKRVSVDTTHFTCMFRKVICTYFYSCWMSLRLN